MTIRFEKRINSDITLWYSAHYNIKKKILKKGLAIFEEPRQPGQYLEDEEKIREGYREGLKRSLKDVIERWQNSGESRTELKDMMVESFELSEREAEEILTELWR